VTGQGQLADSQVWGVRDGRGEGRGVREGEGAGEGMCQGRGRHAPGGKGRRGGGEGVGTLHSMCEEAAWEEVGGEAGGWRMRHAWLGRTRQVIEAVYCC
jgi:hypothetical protein